VEIIHYTATDERRSKCGYYQRLIFFCILLNPNVLVKRIRFKHANWELELLLSMHATTNLAAGKYTYTTDANGCSKSITVTKRLLLKRFLQLQPKCFGEKGSVV
jgi:hypothetical protein